MDLYLLTNKLKCRQTRKISKSNSNILRRSRLYSLQASFANYVIKILVKGFCANYFNENWKWQNWKPSSDNIHKWGEKVWNLTDLMTVSFGRILWGLFSFMFSSELNLELHVYFSFIYTFELKLTRVHSRYSSVSWLYNLTSLDMCPWQYWTNYTCFELLIWFLSVWHVFRAWNNFAQSNDTLAKNILRFCR